MEIIKDTYGNEIAYIVNEDGTTISMLKSTYEAQEAAKVEHLTEIPTK